MPTPWTKAFAYCTAGFEVPSQCSTPSWWDLQLHGVGSTELTRRWESAFPLVVRMGYSSIDEDRTAQSLAGIVVTLAVARGFGWARSGRNSRVHDRRSRIKMGFPQPVVRLGTLGY